LYARLKEQAHAALSIDALVEFGERWLYRAKLVIPATAPFDTTASVPLSNAKTRPLPRWKRWSARRASPPG
ncbi:MAG: hypothetical protein M3Q00_04270, partial [Pseudomonadota bacterium]|nr:hypothetical protein [Pseudomonadota bacterium]